MANEHQRARGSLGIARLGEFLEMRYGTTVRAIEPAPRGWSAETYVATATDGWRCFVKVYEPGRVPPNTLAGLSVLAELRRRGFDHASYPIASNEGARYALLGGYTVVVFDYVAGTQTADFDAGALGALIAQVHELTPAITVPVAREAFDSPYAEELWRILDRACEAAGDESVLALRALAIETRDELERHWVAFDEVRRRCLDASFDTVLTHGDVPWNVMTDAAGTMHLIDWDGLLLAPPERDLWFFDGRPELTQAYAAARGDDHVSPLATTFYVYERYFSEWLGFARVILDGDTPERHPEALALLRRPWRASLRARIEAAR